MKAVVKYIKMFRNDLKSTKSLFGKIIYVLAVVSGVFTIVLCCLALFYEFAALIAKCCLVFSIAMFLVYIAIKAWESRNAERAGGTVMKKKKVLSSIVMIFAVLFEALGIGSTSDVIEWASFAVMIILFILHEHMQEEGEPRRYYFPFILCIIGFVLALF